MSKIKSAFAIVLSTVLILGVAFMCFVSFSYGVDKMHTFNSVLSMMAKDANLGVELADGNNYVGGGYSAVYYPDGVISSQEYSENLADLKEMAEAADAEATDGKKTDARKDYEEYLAKYAAYPDENGPVYLEKEKVFGSEEGTEVSEEFKADFAAAKTILRTRFDRLHLEGAKLEVRDDYTFRVTFPAYTGAQASIANVFSYMGAFDLGYGSSADAATHLVFGEDEDIHDYVKGASSRMSGSTAYVAVSFTKKGRAKIAEWTASAADSSTTLFFFVGDDAVIQLSASQQIDQSTLYISGSYTETTAKLVALTIDTALNTAETGLALTVGEVVRNHAAMGDLAFTLLLIASAVLLVGMLVFFFVRYRALGLAHLYSFLAYLLIMILAVWGIPFLHLGLETFLAVFFGGALLSASNIVAYEAARREYATGKTIVSSVKAGYKRCFWPLFDLHIALLLFSFVTYFIALTELSVFAFTLGLGVALSGLCSLAAGRFYWAAFMSFARDKGKFCNFKREELEDD